MNWPRVASWETAEAGFQPRKLDITAEEVTIAPHSLIEIASYLASGGIAVGKSELGVLRKY